MAAGGDAPRIPRGRRLVLSGLLTLALLAILFALGAWQLRRLAWKEGLLAEIARAEAGPPVPLPAGPLPAPFTKVRAEGRLRDDLRALFGAEVRDTPQGPQMGGQLIEPLERAEGEPLLVDLGWVPDAPRAPLHLPEGKAAITGFLRPPESPHWFSPRDDTAARRFYTLDPAAIGAALGLARVAPDVLVALGPERPGEYPAPAQSLPRPPNNHLSYALTWFGLAAVLAFVFAAWARRALREG